MRKSLYSRARFSDVFTAPMGFSSLLIAFHAIRVQVQADKPFRSSSSSDEDKECSVETVPLLIGSGPLQLSEFLSNQAQCVVLLGEKKEIMNDSRSCTGISEKMTP